jgi:hypothetical protein
MSSTNTAPASEPLADWERELLSMPLAVKVTPRTPAPTLDLPACEDDCEPEKLYRILDLRLRTTIANDLTWGDAHRLLDFMRRQDPQARFDIRSEVGQ